MRLRVRFYQPTFVNNTLCGNPISAIDPFITLSGINGVALASTRLSLIGAGTSTYVEDSKGVFRKVTYRYTNYFGDNILELETEADNAWDYIPLNIQATLSGYNTYSNTFRLYNYDMGCSVNDIEFDIYLVRPYYTIGVTPTPLPYSSFISYRVPLTNKILIYTSNSAPCSLKERYVNGVLLSNNNTYCNIALDLVTITEISYYGANYCNSSKTHNAVQWLPEYQLEVSCINNCQINCQSTTLQENQATSNLDFTNVTQFYIDNNLGEMSRYYSLKYELYDYTGLLIDEAKYTFARFTPISGILNYFQNLYPFNFLTPNIGDYQIKLIIQVDGEIYNVLKTGTPQLGKTYLITNTTNSDFTISGAAANTPYTTFIANGLVPIWGTGSLIEVTNDTLVNLESYRIIQNSTIDFSTFSTPSNLNEKGNVFTSNNTQTTAWTVNDYLIRTIPIYECYDSEIIKSCNYFNVVQIACNSVRVYNNSTSPIVITLETLGTSFLPSGVVTINPLEYYDITYATDGTYKIINGNDDTFHIIHIYCNLQDCILNLIKKLECDCSDACKDKTWYNFNSLIIQCMSYFAQLNELYSLNYMFTALSAEQITELVELNEQLSRFSRYCATDCANPCNCS